MKVAHVIERYAMELLENQGKAIFRANPMTHGLYIDPESEKWLTPSEIVKAYGYFIAGFLIICGGIFGLLVLWVLMEG